MPHLWRNICRHVKTHPPRGEWLCPARGRKAFQSSKRTTFVTLHQLIGTLTPLLATQLPGPPPQTAFASWK
eukprot:6063904-Amphidinium_carterae.3